MSREDFLGLLQARVDRLHEVVTPPATTSRPDVLDDARRALLWHAETATRAMIAEMRRRSAR